MLYSELMFRTEKLSAGSNCNANFIYPQFGLENNFLQRLQSAEGSLLEKLFDHVCSHVNSCEYRHCRALVYNLLDRCSDRTSGDPDCFDASPGNLLRLVLLSVSFKFTKTVSKLPWYAAREKLVRSQVGL